MFRPVRSFMETKVAASFKYKGILLASGIAFHFHYLTRPRSFQVGLIDGQVQSNVIRMQMEFKLRRAQTGSVT